MRPRVKSDACKFCDIVGGRSIARIVLETAELLAFLDHRPLFPGHCLLIPRAHHETLTDLPHELVAPLFHGAQRLASAVERAMTGQGTFVAINNRISQSVPHLHVHVVPRRVGDGLRGFFWPRSAYTSEQHMEQTRRAIEHVLAEKPP